MDRESSSQLASVVDRQELLNRCLGDLALVERVLAIFQSRFDADLEELERAVEANDLEQITRVAHRIKGASANMAAHGLRQRAASIEELARRQVLAEIPPHLQGLHAEWARFVESASTLFEDSSF
ncbi:MAG: Hpt domain-containing protein [Thermoguttaceae bacterium]|jgi:HPt (histidine-containing phosphotransfer) domain-containing protein